MSFQPTPPDYLIKAKLPGKGGRSAVIGAGWIKSHGRISIHFDPCINLNLTRGAQVTMFPVDKVDVNQPVAT